MNNIETVSEINFDKRFFSFFIFINIIAGLIQIPYNNILLGKPWIEPGSLIYIIPLEIFWSTLIFAVIIPIGMNLSERFGYVEPVFNSMLTKEKYPQNTREILTKGFIIGIATGICLLFLSLIFEYIIPITAGQQINKPGIIWRFLASISAGVREETIFRFCLLLIFIWLGRFFIKREYLKSADPLFWTANLLSGIIFGIAHISNLGAMNIEITTAKVSSIIFLNCIAGMTFGYVFFKYGLLSAMLAHFATDIVLHVISPIFS